MFSNDFLNIYYITSAEKGDENQNSPGASSFFKLMKLLILEIKVLIQRFSLSLGKRQ